MLSMNEAKTLILLAIENVYNPVWIEPWNLMSVYDSHLSSVTDSGNINKNGKAFE